MVSEQTQSELEEYLGQVPSFMEAVADPAIDHSWGIMRDLELAETDLSAREKGLVGLGAATAIQCPYCVHFHREQLKMEGLTDEELKEANTVAGSVRYFSTIIHGQEIEMDDFVHETAAIMDHVEKQQTVSGDD